MANRPLKSLRERIREMGVSIQDRPAGSVIEVGRDGSPELLLPGPAILPENTPETSTLFMLSNPRRLLSNSIKGFSASLAEIQENGDLTIQGKRRHVEVLVQRTHRQLDEVGGEMRETTRKKVELANDGRQPIVETDALWAARLLDSWLGTDEVARLPRIAEDLESNPVLAVTALRHSSPAERETLQITGADIVEAEKYASPAKDAFLAGMLQRFEQAVVQAKGLIWRLAGEAGVSDPGAPSAVTVLSRGGVDGDL